MEQGSIPRKGANIHPAALPFSPIQTQYPAAAAATAPTTNLMSYPSETSKVYACNT